MRVEELYQQLSHGELSNLAIAVDGTGTIQKKSHPRIIYHANQALNRLHSRFLLREREAAVVLIDGVSRYELLVEDAIKILAVYAAHGRAVPIQDSFHPDQVSSLGSNLLRVPGVSSENRLFAPGSTLTVIYQARHPQLDPEDLNQEIELPEVLEEALIAYVAAKMYGNMNNPEAQGAAAQHYARYQEICNEVALTSVVSSGGNTSTKKFYQGGWV